MTFVKRRPGRPPGARNKTPEEKAAILANKRAAHRPPGSRGGRLWSGGFIDGHRDEEKTRGYSNADMKRHWSSEEVRQKIKATKMIQLLQRHIFGDPDGTPYELSMSRIRSIEIMLRKVLPDLTRTELKGDFLYRYVVHLPDVLSKEDWIRKYGDHSEEPKQIEGTVVDKSTDTLQ